MPSSYEIAQTDRKENAAQRLQLVMSSHSADRLDELKETTEAASYGEIVRRSLQFLDRLRERSFTIPKAEFADGARKRNTRIQVIISSKTKERLERLRHDGEQELSYSEVVRLALNSYATAVEESARGRSIELEQGDLRIDCDLSLAF